MWRCRMRLTGRSKPTRNGLAPQGVQGGGLRLVASSPCVRLNSNVRPHQMPLSHARWIALGAALAAIFTFGLIGGGIAFSLEEEHQMHGVEPGSEATWALWREAISGFVLGALGSAAALGALAVIVRLFLRRWAK